MLPQLGADSWASPSALSKHGGAAIKAGKGVGSRCHQAGRCSGRAGRLASYPRGGGLAGGPGRDGVGWGGAGEAGIGQRLRG